MSCLLLAALLSLSEVSQGTSGSPTLVFSNGGVTVSGDNLSAAALLAEWSRLGGTAIEGAAELGERKVALPLTAGSESEILEAILGPEFGAIATLRAVPLAGRSQFSRLAIRRVRIAEASPDVPDVPPEVRFVYETPEERVTDTLVPFYPAPTAPPAPPETLFEYYQPAGARPAEEAAPESVGGSPRPAVPVGTPESTHKYYVPEKARVPARSPQI